ncbi:hypothetical protein [Streptomyces sp. NPDC000994]
MTVRAAWLLPGGAGPGQSREDTRITPVGTMAPESELRTRDGVIAGGDPFRATPAGAMDLQIGVGRALVQGTTAQGAYPVAITAPETLRFTDGNAQHPRIDSVMLRISDGLYDASGDALAQVVIVEGTAAPSPVAPTLPAASLRLWDVTVPAGASAGVGGIPWASALADRRRFTSSYGGIIPRGYGLSFAGSYDGQYRDNGTALERWNAADAAWVKVVPDPAVTTVMGWTALTSLGAFQTGFRAGSPTPRMRKIRVAGTEVWEFEGRITCTTFPANSTNVVFTFNAGHRVASERGFRAYSSGSSFYSVRVGFTSAGNLNAGVPTAAGAGTTNFVLDDIRITNPSA